MIFLLYFYFASFELEYFFEDQTIHTKNDDDDGGGGGGGDGDLYIYDVSTLKFKFISLLKL